MKYKLLPVLCLFVLAAVLNTFPAGAATTPTAKPTVKPTLKPTAKPTISLAAHTLSATSSASASAGSTKQPAGEVLNDQINKLKEKIASRVSELNLVEKRGIIADVVEVSGNQVTLKDFAGHTRFIDVDELTKFSSPSAKATFGLSDLTKNTRISVLGLYNKQSKRILARFIDTVVMPVIISGEVSDIDKENYTLTVSTDDQKQKKVDIETITKISSYTKDDGLAKYGFSKAKIGDRVIAVGYPDKKDPTLLVASRITDFLELPKNPKIAVSVPTPTTEEEVKPSTGSGKKITPVK